MQRPMHSACKSCRMFRYVPEGAGDCPLCNSDVSTKMAVNCGR